MTCEQALQMMEDLVDGDLDRQHRLRVRLHLLICRHCRRYLATYRLTLKVERTAYPADDSGNQDEQIPEELVAAILEAARATTF